MVCKDIRSENFVQPFYALPLFKKINAGFLAEVAGCFHLYKSCGCFSPFKKYRSKKGQGFRGINSSMKTNLGILTTVQKPGCKPKVFG